jgi:hypothetical protein
MDQSHSQSSRKLTGVWQGIYSYPQGGPTVPFTATLIEAGNSLSGSVHEPCVMFGNPNEILFATLLGTRCDNAVSFVKSYDGSNPSYSSVNYEGSVSGDANEIEGVWRVPGNWSGKFLMIRSGDQPEKAAEREGATLPGKSAPELIPAGQK